MKNENFIFRLTRTNARFFKLAVFSIAFLLPACTRHVSFPHANLDTNQGPDIYDFYMVPNIHYQTEGEPLQTGDLYLPHGTSNRAAVILIHGGSWSWGHRCQMNGTARRLARAGFVVFNIDYRFAPKHRYPAQIEDCQAALRWLKINAAKFKVDPSRIGAFGYSAGGYLAALMGTLNSIDSSSKVQAVVAGGTPHDFTKYPDSPAVLKLLGKTIEEDPELFKAASPFYNVTPDDPPMFLYHGTFDSTVDPSHTIDMHKALSEAGIFNEMYLRIGWGHIALFLFDSTTDTKAINFLKRTLN